MHSIKQIVGVTHHIAADAEGYISAIRLTGLKWGNYETAIGGMTSGKLAGAAGGSALCMKPTVINTNLAVVPGAEMWVEAAQIGTATAASTNVEICFDAAEGEKRYGFIRHLLTATANAKAMANSDVTSTTAYGIKVPSDARRITSMIPLLGGTVAAATAVGGLANVRLEGGLPDGDFGLTCGGFAGLASTAAQQMGYFEPDQIQTNVRVSPGSIIQVYTECVATDWGAPNIGIAIEMACSEAPNPMTYRHRCLLVGGVDTWVLLTSDGTLTTPGPLTVPVGMNRIRQVIFAEGDSTPTAAVRNHGTMLKLTGVNDGEALLILNAVTGEGVPTTGNAGTACGAKRRDVDIPVTPGKQISPYIDMSSGVDTSAPYASVTLGFSQ